MSYFRLSTVIIFLISISISVWFVKNGFTETDVSQKDKSQVTDLIENFAGFGEPDQPGYSLKYRLSFSQENSCHLVLIETTTINQGSTNKKITTIKEFSLSSLNQNYKQINSMGRELILYDVKNGNSITVKRKNSKLEDQEREILENSLGFHFEEKEDAISFIKIFSKIMQTCGG